MSVVDDDLIFECHSFLRSVFSFFIFGFVNMAHQAIELEGTRSNLDILHVAGAKGGNLVCYETMSAM